MDNWYIKIQVLIQVLNKEKCNERQTSSTFSKMFFRLSERMSAMHFEKHMGIVCILYASFLKGQRNVSFLRPDLN